MSKVIFLAIVLAVAVFIGPFIFIWSVNTLFGLTIGYTLKNWFAGLILLMSIRSGHYTKTEA